MQTLNMLEAKTHLSRLVEALESGVEDEILIARHGRPVARLSGLEKVDASRRIGVAKGLFDVPDDIDAHNDEVARLFLA
jgi:antitoxin (DNA-binding transcriptional repressor) of toxin-antitoxin stability system